LDLSHPELERTLAAVEGRYKHVHCRGLLGTYDDGLVWLTKPENLRRPKCILWMGSSIGNLNRLEAADFLKGFSRILRDQDTMLIGVDACQDRDKVLHAYNDGEGKTHEFILNGLDHANTLSGREIFRKGEWKVIGEYDEEAGRHQAFVSPVRNVMVEGVSVEAGERIRIEESYKYSLIQSTELWEKAQLVSKARFGDSLNQYRKSSPTLFPIRKNPPLASYTSLLTLSPIAFVNLMLLPRSIFPTKPSTTYMSCY
jgi:EasF-like predicted methyltransferase